MTAEPSSRARTIIVGLVSSIVAIIGTLIAIGASHQYYTRHVGPWTVGAATVGIGLGILGGSVLAATAFWFTFRRESSVARARRIIIHSVEALLAYVGLVAGAGVGYAYRDSGHTVAGAIAVGIGSALGAWLAAALLGVLVEIANSLRRLVAAAAASDLQASEGEPVPPSAVGGTPDPLIHPF
jgi:MFS family permease